MEITRGRQLGRLKSDGFGGRIEQLGGRGVQPVTHLHGAWGKWQGRWDGETREGKERKKERKAFLLQPRHLVLSKSCALQGGKGDEEQKKN